jgi:hypothetical protein
MFFAAELTSSSHHLSPAFHHKFTIKEPPSAPRFFAKPPAKTPLHHARKKLKQKTTAEPKLRRHLV